jgi:hypothetical protein
MYRIAPTTIAVLLCLAACQDAPYVTGPDPGPNTPTLAIMDGVHSGPAGFYFLPPLVDAPNSTGTFDGNLSPVVRICALDGDVCSGLDLDVLSTGGSGASSITVDTDGEAYIAVWHTKGMGLSPSTNYRLRVFVGMLQLGTLDLDVVAGPQNLKNVPSDMVGLVVDRPLPIKFRIETGIVGEVIVTPSTAMINEGQTQQFTVAFRDLHGADLTGPSATWASSDMGVATVDGSGLATGVVEGSATITAVNEWVSGTANLTVLPAGLTWAAASPTTETLWGIWGSSGTDVFAVGLSGTILHYDGSAWTKMTIPPSVSSCTVVDVWGTSATDVFATMGGSYACGGILHYNGSAWSISGQIPVPDSEDVYPLYALWGNESSNVYAAGQDGIVAHFDGADWSAVQLSNGMCAEPPLQAIWGSSGSDIYAVDDYGTIQHYNGSAWTPTKVGDELLTGVWGSSANDVFVVGHEGKVMHYGGTGWTQVEEPSLFGTGPHFEDVWGSSGSDVFLVAQGGLMLHYDGEDWDQVTGLPAGTNDLHSIWGSSEDNVFAVGESGLILHGTR